MPSRLSHVSLVRASWVISGIAGARRGWKGATRQGNTVWEGASSTAYFARRHHATSFLFRLLAARRHQLPHCSDEAQDATQWAYGLCLSVWSSCHMWISQSESPVVVLVTASSRYDEMAFALGSVAIFPSLLGSFLPPACSQHSFRTCHSCTSSVVERSEALPELSTRGSVFLPRRNRDARLARSVTSV